MNENQSVECQLAGGKWPSRFIPGRFIPGKFIP